MSDTMCAKTTETSRCQRCGSEFDWLSDGTKVHAGKRYFESDSLLCLERQLNAANERIKRLEEALEGTVKWIVHLADSGDAGFWDVEKQLEIIAARAALKKESKP